MGATIITTTESGVTDKVCRLVNYDWRRKFKNPLAKTYKVISKRRDSTIVTATFDQPHDLQIGDRITFSNCGVYLDPVGVVENPAVASIPAANQITFINSQNPGNQAETPISPPGDCLRFGYNRLRLGVRLAVIASANHVVGSNYCGIVQGSGDYNFKSNGARCCGFLFGGTGTFDGVNKLTYSTSWLAKKTNATLAKYTSFATGTLPAGRAKPQILVYDQLIVTSFITHSMGISTDYTTAKTADDFAAVMKHIGDINTIPGMTQKQSYNGVYRIEPHDGLPQWAEFVWSDPNVPVELFDFAYSVLAWP